MEAAAAAVAASAARAISVEVFNLYITNISLAAIKGHPCLYVALRPHNYY